MSSSVKDIDIEHWAHHFFNDIINIKNFDPNITKIDEKLYKNTLVYYIGYVAINYLKYIKIYVNPFCLIFNRVNWYFEEINRNRYLTLVSANKSKELKHKFKNMKNYGVTLEI